jgi:hypothetical protein
MSNATDNAKANWEYSYAAVCLALGMRVEAVGESLISESAGARVLRAFDPAAPRSARMLRLAEQLRHVADAQAAAGILPMELLR